MSSSDINNCPSDDCGQLWYVCKYCARAYKIPKDLLQHKKENHLTRLKEDRIKIKENRCRQRCLMESPSSDVSKKNKKIKLEESRLTGLQNGILGTKHGPDSSPSSTDRANHRPNRKARAQHKLFKKELENGEDEDVPEKKKPMNVNEQRMTRTSTRNRNNIKMEPKEEVKIEPKDRRLRKRASGIPSVNTNGDSSSPKKKSKPHPFSSSGYKKKKMKFIKEGRRNTFKCEDCSRIVVGIRNYQLHLDTHG